MCARVCAWVYVYGVRACVCVCVGFFGRWYPPTSVAIPVRLRSAGLAYPNPIYSYLGLLLAHDTKISVHITWARKAGAYPAFYPCHRHLNSFAPHRAAGYTYEPLWSTTYVCFRSHVTLRVAGRAPYGCVKFPPACCRAGQYASLYGYLRLFSVARCALHCAARHRRVSIYAS